MSTDQWLALASLAAGALAIVWAVVATRACRAAQRSLDELGKEIRAFQAKSKAELALAQGEYAAYMADKMSGKPRQGMLVPGVTDPADWLDLMKKTEPPK